MAAARLEQMNRVTVFVEEMPAVIRNLASQLRKRDAPTASLQHRNSLVYSAPACIMTADVPSPVVLQYTNPGLKRTTCCSFITRKPTSIMVRIPLICLRPGPACLCYADVHAEHSSLRKPVLHEIRMFCCGHCETGANVLWLALWAA